MSWSNGQAKNVWYSFNVKNESFCWSRDPFTWQSAYDEKGQYIADTSRLVFTDAIQGYRLNYAHFKSMKTSVFLLASQSFLFTSYKPLSRVWNSWITFWNEKLWLCLRNSEDHLKDCQISPNEPLIQEQDWVSY